MTVGVALALGAALAVTAAAAPKPTLSVRRGQHFLVQGSHFGPNERVTVRVRARARYRRLARTSAVGAFTADFGRLHLRRCEGFDVTAVGAVGDRAVVKHSIPPACITQ